MNAGLVYLLARAPTAFARRTRRRFSGARGALVLIGLVLVLSFVLVPQLVVYVMQDRPGLSPDAVERVRTFAPVALFVFILMASRGGTIAFKGAEIQFLFPAPVGRRELILYDAVSKLRVQVFASLWAAIFLLRFAELWYVAIIAPFIALGVLQFSGQAIGLLLAAAERRFGKLAERGAVLGLWAIVIAAAIVAYAGTPENAGRMAVAERFSASPPIAVMSWLARPPIEVFLASSVPAFVGWTAVSVGELLLLLGVAMAFDRAYTEMALQRSQKVAARLARMRSSGVAIARSSSSRGLRIPQLPYFGGAGPIAWRQLQELSRNYRGALMLGLLPIVSVILMHWMLEAAPGIRAPGTPTEAFLIGLVLAMPLMTLNAGFDFRRDLDRMPLLKALPVSPFAMAAGQISATVLLLCVWQLIAVAALSMAMEPVTPAFLVSFLMIIVPLNAVFMALDNLLFLLMPYRVVANDPGRVTFMGRPFIMMFVKVLLFLALAAVLAILVAVAWAFGLRSVVEVAGVVALSLSVVAVSMILAVAKAFTAFDVARDIQD